MDLSRNGGQQVTNGYGQRSQRGDPQPEPIAGTVRDSPQMSVRHCPTAHFGGLECCDKQDRYNHERSRCCVSRMRQWTSSGLCRVGFAKEFLRGEHSINPAVLDPHVHFAARRLRRNSHPRAVNFEHFAGHRVALPAAEAMNGATLTRTRSPFCTFIS